MHLHNTSLFQLFQEDNIVKYKSEVAFFLINKIHQNNNKKNPNQQQSLPIRNPTVIPVSIMDTLHF